jgi:N-acetylglucosamine kinase-like BadF-type ATPase
MILIADSGSTKTDWVCISEDGKRRIDFKSLGYNPNYITGDEIRGDILKNIPENFPIDEVKEIYFYGAGVTELQYDFMRGVLKSVFPLAETVFIAMDLLAAARALLGRESGFAAILGTGTEFLSLRWRKNNPKHRLAWIHSW